uniref:Transcriptional regulator n=1 Tax=Thermosporothrix sp. COM3 TaxID=2490863 RepID=A0A455SLZ8_9CHLR|nr:transcriptional regulator [Thermosporothrix sp. COM3]
MQGDINIASFAELLADPTRVSILLLLSDGRAFTAGELARKSKVAPSTISGHLRRLVDEGVLRMEKQGRNRFFTLRDPSITHVLETLALYAPTQAIRTLSESEQASAVRQARMCYNHLAGELGVRITEAMERRGLVEALEEGYIVTAAGEEWLDSLRVDRSKLKKREPIFVPWHIDWSERRHHLAGALAAALARRLFELKWMFRLPDSRAVRLTDAGKQGLGEMLGLEVH